MKLLLSQDAEIFATFEWRKNEWAISTKDATILSWWKTPSDFFTGLAAIFEWESIGYDVLIVNWADWDQYKDEFKRREQAIIKSKIYLKPNEKPPEGIRLQRGPKGGLYYETKIKVKYDEEALTDKEANTLLTNMQQYLSMSQQVERPVSGFHYKGAADFILKEGKCYVGNEKFSTEEMSIIKKLKMPRESHACYKNSALFVLGALSYKVPNIKYVEGYGWRKGLIPLEHAWVTVNDKVFDTTWPKQGDTVYFGASFTPEEVYHMYIEEDRKTAGMINVPELNFPYLKTPRKK